MNTTISPQVRILAVVGLLAAVGLGASLLVFGHGSSKTAGPAATTHSTQRSSTPAHTTPRTHSTPAKAIPAAKHTAKTHVSSRTQAKKTKPTGFRGNRVYANLPASTQQAPPVKPSTLERWQGRGGILGALAALGLLLLKFGAPVFAVLAKFKGVLAGLKFLSLGKVFITGGSMLISIVLEATSFG